MQDQLNKPWNGRRLVIVGGMGSVEDVAHAAIFLMTNPQVTGGETLVDFV